jgi:hypothetical protein
MGSCPGPDVAMTGSPDRAGLRQGGEVLGMSTIVGRVARQPPGLFVPRRTRPVVAAPTGRPWPLDPGAGRVVRKMSPQFEDAVQATLQALRARSWAGSQVRQRYRQPNVTACGRFADVRDAVGVAIPATSSGSVKIRFTPADRPEVSLTSGKLQPERARRGGCRSGRHRLGTPAAHPGLPTWASVGPCSAAD